MDDGKSRSDEIAFRVAALPQASEVKYGHKIGQYCQELIINLNHLPTKVIKFARYAFLRSLRLLSSISVIPLESFQTMVV